MSGDKKSLSANNSQFLIYQTENGETKIDVRFQDETVWLTQKTMAELFQVKPQNITMHLKNIFAKGELTEEATCKEFLQVQTEGKREVKVRIRKIQTKAAKIIDPGRPGF